MKKILVGFCTISFLGGLALAPRAAAQTIKIVVGPTMDDSYAIWNGEYQIWLGTDPNLKVIIKGIRIAIGTVVMTEVVIGIIVPERVRAVGPNTLSIKRTQNSQKVKSLELR